MYRTGEPVEALSFARQYLSGDTVFGYSNLLGMLSILSVTGDPPHGGEVHPDGDEILYVISGRLRVTGESDPTAAIELGAGDACIVRKREWHQVIMIEPAQLIHITPGPRGDYRPLWVRAFNSR